MGFPNVTVQDSYALCRVFKKNMVVSKPKETLDNISSAETSRDETANDENSIRDHEMSSKFDPSSSELPQGTTTPVAANDDLFPHHIASHEVNSLINQYYFPELDNISNFTFQVINRAI